MNNIMYELIKEYTSLVYPISRIRVDKKRHVISTKGNFKRVIVIGDNFYIISHDSERYIAMKTLSSILSRVFNIKEEETIPIIKKHLNLR